MRRVVLPALMTALLLCGCISGKSCEEKIAEKRALFSEQSGLSFTAEVTADLGDEEFSCVLDCEKTPDGVRVCVQQPQELAGVAALVSPDGEAAEFEGLWLCLPLDENGVSPLKAMAHLVQALTTAHLTGAYELSGLEKQYIAAETYLGETKSVTVLYALPELVPENAEIVSDGRAVIKCSLRDFSQ